MTYHFFVYGTLRRGHPNHSMLEGRYSSVTEATVAGFTVKTVYGLPFAIPRPGATLSGELYTTDDEQLLIDLDGLEGYRGPDAFASNLYNREQIEVNGIKAYIYIKNDRFGER